MLRALFVLIVVLGAASAYGQSPQGPSSSALDASNSAENNPIEAALRQYVAAFNANDAAALAALWAPKGIYANKNTSERTVGREALQRDFESLFKESPGVRLAGALDEVRMVKPDVAAADGQATVVFPSGETIQTGFSAIYVKEGEAWLVDSIHESELPSPETPRDALAALEWMIGQWVDQTDAAQVDTVVRWSPSQSFLLRSFSAKVENEEPMEGTQVIGWDPNRRQIRSWTFNSDGSFGEATWSRNGDDWMVKSTQTLADGRLAAGTQVITRGDDDTVTVQTLGRTIDGEPTPATDPVTVVRVASMPEEETVPTAEQEPNSVANERPGADESQSSPAKEEGEQP